METNIELDIFKPELPEIVKAKLKPVAFNQTVKVVNSEEDLKSAKLVVDSIDEVTSFFKGYISPIKSAFDKAHKVVTTFEKEQLASGITLKTQQNSEISDYNRRVFECQKRQADYTNAFISNISLMEQVIAQGKRNYQSLLDKIDAQIELNKLESLPVPVADKIDAIEEAKKEVSRQTEQVIIPQVQSTPVKVVLKKDEKKEVKSFFIKDEIKAIDYILGKYYEAIKINDFDSATFYRGLLNIDLAKKQVIEALKKEDFQKLNFVDCTITYK